MRLAGLTRASVYSPLAAVALIAACASAPEVSTTLDPDADPGRYATFAFTQGDPQRLNVVTDPQVLRRLQQMVTRQLAVKGYVAAAPGQAADMGVNFAARVEDAQRVFMTGSGFQEYGWRNRQLGGYETVNYREGTLLVDVVDLKQTRLMWRAHVAEELTPGYSEENWIKIDRALAEAFKTLPARRK